MIMTAEHTIEAITVLIFTRVIFLPYTQQIQLFTNDLRYAASLQNSTL